MGNLIASVLQRAQLDGMGGKVIEIIEQRVEARRAFNEVGPGIFEEIEELVISREEV
jgi:hypothetical protein